MVTGIERWKEYFSDYKDKYVLIGGAACNLLEEEFDMNPRATKDLDLVLVVEALTPDFGLRLWDFIKAASGYEPARQHHRARGGKESVCRHKQDEGTCGQAERRIGAANRL